ncbi:hypothetical protein [Thalassoglobus polymorphus]|uniref:Uncharacterized protein n=1 Tax=Thalassoglobus polymorphus TaxID=2527994 RepID=A0A517QHI4_9PLAN|nr:hypothetical protein [Thalassoglobus polymorphus]QDT31092.1 hypothetical protein Mal48_03230 [Thalassoglobus polymorphus]
MIRVLGAGTGNWCCDWATLEPIYDSISRPSGLTAAWASLSGRVIFARVGSVKVDLLGGNFIFSL